MKKLFVLVLVALLLSACQVGMTQQQIGTPTPFVLWTGTPTMSIAITPLGATVSTTPSALPTASMPPQPTATPNVAEAALQTLMAPASSPTPGSEGTPTTIPMVNCAIRAFIKEEGGHRQVEDAALVTMHWNNGYGQFQTAKACGFLASLGITQFDIIWDSLANNVSVVLVPSAVLTPEKVSEFARVIGSPRVGFIHTFEGRQEAIDFTNNPACGPVTLYHVYDRADWSPNNAYYCDFLLSQLTPTPAP